MGEAGNDFLKGNYQLALDKYYIMGNMFPGVYGYHLAYSQINASLTKLKANIPLEYEDNPTGFNIAGCRGYGERNLPCINSLNDNRDVYMSGLRSIHYLLSAHDFNAYGNKIMTCNALNASLIKPAAIDPIFSYIESSISKPTDDYCNSKNEKPALFLRENILPPLFIYAL